MKASLLPLVLIVMMGCDLWAPREGWALREEGPCGGVWGWGSLWQVAHCEASCLELQPGQIHSSTWAVSATEWVSGVVIVDLGEAFWMGESCDRAALLRGVPGHEDAVSVSGMDSWVRE